MLTGQSDELVALAALRNLDAVAVGPCLDLAVAPAVEECVTERLSGTSGRLGGRGVLLSSLIGSDLRVAAKGSNELVAVAWLRNWNTTLVAPSLQVGVRPLRVEPVAWVCGSLASLLSGFGVVGAGGGQEGVAGTWRWVWDLVVVQPRLELGLSPTVRCQ